jgi:GDP-L-fucose synthase
MKIIVTGGTGLVGSAFNNIETDHEIILLGTSDYDLRSSSEVNKMFKNESPDAVIHLAAKVGGVKGNSDYVADFFYDNIKINTNVLEVARKNNVSKVLSLLSTCIYPDNAIYPLTENQIHSGPPHESNFGYAYAKRMLEVQSRAIRKQYGLKYITAVPNNIYGPNDNFDLINSHVIPSIIRKIYEFKNYKNIPEFWGDGKALREFTYSKDIAKALLFLIDNYEEEDPINIGCTKEISIKSLVEEISKILNVKTDKFLWNTKMPKGQHKKPSNNVSFLKINKDFKYTSLQSGLSETIKWFEKNYPEIRGIK